MPVDDGPAPEQDEPREPRSSKSYLDAIVVAERAFRDYNTRADAIDKIYASLEHQGNADRQREFAMFWANIQVLAPSIFSRPPIPIATTRFKDRDPVARTAAELLERCLIVTFEKEDIEGVLRMVRDDLAVVGRGVPWIRYDTKYEKDRVCIEHVDRKDFLHQPARNWKEVDWVAKRSWLTKKEIRKRFTNLDESDLGDIAYTVQSEHKELGASDDIEKAGIWEMWHKSDEKVVWVTDGLDKTLEEGKPHLTLDGFFPCPKPVYSTVQRGSLIPVPDHAFYQDQLHEINDLTARIGAMQEALKVRAFYPSGVGEIGDAIEAALKSKDNRQVMIPISNWAVFGGGSAKDSIVWLPIDQISQCITDCVALRRQYIDDVYQITGLSDIMRGATDPDETLGAQQLKSQYGSIRVHDRQNELVRVAKDVSCIVGEIIAENFSSKTMMEMAQMELKTDADVKKEIAAVIKQAEDQVRQQMANPEMQKQAQENPQQAQQMLAQLGQQTQAQIDKLSAQPTVEKVVKLLREQRLRPFVLDIETDSTIQPDEDAEKQRRSELTQAVGGMMAQMVPMVQAMPEMASFAGEFTKFAVGAFRSNRELDVALDELIDNMKAKAGQPQQPDPATVAAQAEAEQAKEELAFRRDEMNAKGQAEMKKLSIEEQRVASDAEQRRLEGEAKLAQIQAAAEAARQKHAQAMQLGELQLEQLREKGRLQAQSAQIKDAAVIRTAQIAEHSADHDAALSSQQAEQSAEHQDAAFQQKSALNEQAAQRPAV